MQHTKIDKLKEDNIRTIHLKLKGILQLTSKFLFLFYLFFNLTFGIMKHDESCFLFWYKSASIGGNQEIRIKINPYYYY